MLETEGDVLEGVVGAGRGLAVDVQRISPVVEEME